jgi:hypothetical protein
MNSEASSVIVLLRARPGSIVLPAESDTAFVERDEPLVRDRNSVGIARQIGQHRLRPGERALRIDHPLRKDRRIGKRCVLAEEAQLAPTMCIGEFLQEAAPEQSREHAHRQEEAGSACDRPFTVR